jgi:hypothetical protein
MIRKSNHPEHRKVKLKNKLLGMGVPTSERKPGSRGRRVQSGKGSSNKVSDETKNSSVANALNKSSRRRSGERSSRSESSEHSHKSSHRSKIETSPPKDMSKSSSSSSDMEIKNESTEIKAEANKTYKLEGRNLKEMENAIDRNPLSILKEGSKYISRENKKVIEKAVNAHCKKISSKVADYNDFRNRFPSKMLTHRNNSDEIQKEIDNNLFDSVLEKYLDLYGNEESETKSINDELFLTGLRNQYESATKNFREYNIGRRT